MTATMRVAVDQVRTGWNTFWFRPESTSTIAVVRIVFGFVATLWTLSQAPTLLTFYGPEGVVPVAPTRATGSWSLLYVSSSAPVVIGLWAATLVAAVGVMIGFKTRLATIALYIGVMSFERRDPYILNAGEALLRSLAFFLVFAPAGAALSVDRWRRARNTFWESPLRAPWALRLIQIQLSVIYLSTVWEKVGGERWRNGTAVAYTLRIQDIRRFPTPAFLSDSVVLSEILTYGTLVLELSLAVLVWNRALRPWVLAAGVSLHLSIAYTVMVGFFSMLMLTTYLTFVPPEKADQLVASARRWWRARRRHRGAGPPSAPSAPSARIPRPRRAEPAHVPSTSRPSRRGRVPAGARSR